MFRFGVTVAEGKGGSKAGTITPNNKEPEKLTFLGARLFSNYQASAKLQAVRRPA
jgi:hypothetical protein